MRIGSAALRGDRRLLINRWVARLGFRCMLGNADEAEDSWRSNWKRAMRTLRSAGSIVMAGVLLLPGLAAGQQPIFYPAKGQSGQQQNRDQGECQVWAQQTTGVNPAALAQAPAPPPPRAPAVGGGERLAGAARGAIIGEIAGGHGGEGAAVGAMVGGAKARRNQAQQQQAAQANTDSARSTQMSTYNRATGACMEGRGYTVR